MRTILIVIWVIVVWAGMFTTIAMSMSSDYAFLYASPKPIITTELIEAGHKVLDLGFDCAKSGAERVACHAQLATVIKGYVK